MNRSLSCHLACLSIFICSATLLLRAADTAPIAVKPVDAPEPGIPVTNKLVVQKCGGCHAQDKDGNMTRISWVRTTPEGWEEAIKRMIRLNGLSLTTPEAREIVHYLANDHGLAPEEAKPVMYVNERRSVDEQVPDQVREVCNACHAYGKPASWRRSKEEWDLLYKMHIGYFPSSEMTSFMRPPPLPGAPPPTKPEDLKQPYEKALDFLKTSFPLSTPEWGAFRTTIQKPRVTGRWLVAAYKPGEGPYYGEMVVAGTNDPELFDTKTRLVGANNGTVITRSGQATVYNGYAWRGRSTTKDVVAGPQAAEKVREVMMLSRDQSQVEGRWMWGDYQEFGFEVRMYRATPGLTLLGLNTPSLHSDATQTVHVFGDGFPKALKPTDIDLGSGVSVKRVTKISPSQITLEIAVGKGATPGKRDIAVAGTVLPAAVAVYDHIDFVKVTPDTGLSRLGGGPHPKGYVQFEAIAYLNGPDGKPNTPDDISLGPVQAKWSLKEFYATFGDDDTQYVGGLNSETGLFTPSVDGPNPERKFSRNNYGDVWVEAEVSKDLPPGKTADVKPQPLTARSYLIVTVPQYLRYDQPEVAP